MRIPVSDFGGEVRAAIRQFNLDVAGPSAQAPDGKLGSEDVDQIDRALAGSLTPAQRRLLQGVKDVINNRAEVVRSENVDAAIRYIVAGKRPMERLKDFTSGDGGKVEVNGKEVRVKLTEDHFRDLSLKERETIIEKTVKGDGYWPSWTWVFIILLFPVMFWVLFTDFSPGKRGINDDEARLLGALLRSTPSRQTAALYAQLEQAGVIDKLRRELAEDNVDASKFFADATFDRKSLDEIAAEMYHRGTRDSVLEGIGRVAETRGDAAAEDLGNKLFTNGTMRRLAPEAYRQTHGQVMACREPEDIKTPEQYLREFDDLTRQDRQSAQAFLDALPTGTQKAMWDVFTSHHDRGQFEATMDLQSCANQVLSGQRLRERVVQTLNNISRKYPNGAQIIENSVKLLREQGKLQEIFPFIYREFDPQKLTSDADIRTQQEWKAEFKRQREANLKVFEEVLSSLPPSVHATLRADFEAHHFNMATAGERELNEFVSKMDLESIATQIVMNQRTAEGAAQLLAKVRDKYKPQGPTWAGNIARKLDRQGSFSTMLKDELSIEARPKAGTELSHIQSRQELVSEALAVTQQHRSRVTKLQNVLRTLEGGDAIAERLQQEFDRGHDSDTYVKKMKMEDTARRVVAHFSGNRRDFVAAIKQVTLKHSSTQDRHIASDIADENRATITRLFGSDINYVFQKPVVRSPHDFRTASGELDRGRWQAHLRAVLLSESDWRKKFDEDRVADERELTDLMGALPDSTRTWVKGQFDNSHDVRMLMDKVNLVSFARDAVNASLGEGSRRWNRWHDDWFSVKEALIVIKEKYGAPLADQLAWEVERRPDDVLMKRLLPIIEAEGPPTPRTPCKTRAELQRREQLAAAARRRRDDEEDALDEALRDLPADAGSFSTTMRERFKAETRLKREQWERELEKSLAEVQAEEQKNQPQPQPAPQPTPA